MYVHVYVGMQLEVYARTLRIVDADLPTRDFYSVNGVELCKCWILISLYLPSECILI